MPGTYDAGSVSRRQSTTTIIDVNVTPEWTDLNGPDDEYVIKVNGFPIKRMNAHAAKRMGIITENR